MTAAEQKFIEQLTRQYLVKWATQVVGWEPPDNVVTLDTGTAHVRVTTDFALSKGWISAKNATPDGINSYKVLAAGFAVATSFLKR